jgi:hypothetical protein
MMSDDEKRAAAEKLSRLLPQVKEHLLVRCGGDEGGRYEFTVWPRGGGEVISRTVPRADLDESEADAIKPSTVWLFAVVANKFGDGPAPPPEPDPAPRTTPRRRFTPSAGTRKQPPRRLTSRRRSRR